MKIPFSFAGLKKVFTRKKRDDIDDDFDFSDFDDDELGESVPSEGEEGAPKEHEEPAADETETTDGGEKGPDGEETPESSPSPEAPDDGYNDEPFPESDYPDVFDDEKKGLSGRGRIIVIAAAASLVLVIGGGAMMFLGGDGEADGGTARVSLAMPEKGAGSGVTALTPPGAEGAGGEGMGQASPDGDGQGLKAAGLLESGVVVPAVSVGAYDKIARIDNVEPLPAAPIPELTETTAEGPLPKVAADGRKPWQVYARPFDARDDRPRISIVVTGLGLSNEATRAAIQRLPPDITLAFSPYGRSLDRWIPDARNAGHEVFLTLPMEPQSFPLDDPGPLAMLTSVPSTMNIQRLDGVMGKGSGYVGLVTEMGSQFSDSEKHLKPIMETLRDRGLMLVDAGDQNVSKAPAMASELGVPRAIVNIVLDNDPAPEAIRARLAELESVAKEYFVAIAIAQPYPSTIAVLREWSMTVKDRNIALAPLSASADKQILP
ncbi:MAG: divergent polysaccharide deacetylase family protein [Rhodospirillales bacterium]|nr:divergent polysaccharide deacetylase family protein [Rhodospirillales bacterium]MCW8952879.1 divergent polysaccharide deacetylase family protein [Rhodospirillales bacterium]MCW8970309.1 divergent polysaccharide deacetylase family protein [Rhodospirillales bacterium]MCW9038955.1 divergent polysaccharide deacetylase family protein [Rhodospirillales bacterium]